MNALQFLSGIIYWLLWPVFFLILRRSQRTRVLVVCGKSALVVKTWFGDNKWTLPGGGVHTGEAVKDGATRELYEEVGITLDRRLLRDNGRTDYKNRGITTRLIRFSARVRKRPDIRKQWYEVSHSEWVPLKQLTTANTDQAALDHIAAWQTKS